MKALPTAQIYTCEVLGDMADIHLSIRHLFNTHITKRCCKQTCNRNTIANQCFPVLKCKLTTLTSCELFERQLRTKTNFFYLTHFCENKNILPM